MRRALALPALGALVAALVMLVAGARDERSLAFSSDAAITGEVGRFDPGEYGCQAPVRVVAPFRAIAPAIAEPDREPGGPVRLRVLRDGRSLAVGVVQHVNNGDRPHVRLDHEIPMGSPIVVCVENLQGRPLGVFGDPDGRADPSSLRVDGVLVAGDLALDFYADHPRSVVAQAGEIARRTARFAAGFGGAWTAWLMAALVLLAAPALLAAALRDADRP